jgi:hypothetical protein
MRRRATRRARAASTRYVVAPPLNTRLLPARTVQVDVGEWTVVTRVMWVACIACGHPASTQLDATGDTGHAGSDGAGDCTYATSFASDEATISEAGRWAHAATQWQRVRAHGGAALAAAYTEVYDDAYAYLGTWSCGDDYEIVATAYSANGKAGEAEILSRVTDAAGSVRAYEFLYNTGGSWQFVRWNGALGDFTVLDGGGTPNGGTGTQTRETAVGSTMTLYWRNAAGDAWQLLATEHDTVLPTGKPGMSFYVHASDQNIDDIGFLDWSVTPL